MPIPLSRYKQSLIPNNFNIRNKIIFVKKEYLFIFQVNNTQIISGQFSTIVGQEISVDWGDGNVQSTYSGINQAWSKDYGSAGDRTVRIFKSVMLTKFRMDAVGADISFDVTNLPTRLTYLYVYGSNTLFGNIANLPAKLEYLSVSGNNTLSGDIVNLPTRLTYLVVSGNNTLFGNITNLPAGLTYFYMYGSNTLSGNIANLPTGLTTLYEGGNNTISGDIANLPTGLTTLSISGNNTLFGNIANLLTGLTYLYIRGNNTVADYSGKAWITKPATFYIIPVGAGGLSEAEIDQLFIDFDNDFVWAAGNVITLTGTNAAPTAASAAARTNIANEGCTITTN